MARKKSTREIRRERIREHAKKINQEFRKSLSTAIITALSLITALAWQGVINGYLTKITSLSPVQSQFISALIITFIAAVLIMILTRIKPA